jgi:hypothetical protein
MDCLPARIQQTLGPSISWRVSRCRMTSIASSIALGAIP